MKKVLMILMAAFLFIGIAACTETTEPTTVTTEAPETTVTTEPASTEPVITEPVNQLPVITGADNVTVALNGTFDPEEEVTASDPEDGDLTAEIVITGTVDLTTAGSYVLTYTVEDSEGEEVVVRRVVTVRRDDITYPTGFYNFKFATTELRHTLMAAAEKYLMNNMYGGIPLFANGGFNLYSSRLQLPVEEYVAVMGYGTGFATMTADDSTVLMDDGELGEAGKYTYRAAATGNPETWNQWLYDDSVTSDYMGVYMDALYTYQFNEDKTGYAVVPSMAASDPEPINSTITETGKEVSKTWQITLRDDLEWYYHPDTDITGLPTGHEVIDAHDFVDTFKLALDKGWFRAISGGGDFLTSTNKIKNAQEYRDGTADWEDVGIKLIDDLTFEFTFVDDQSDWNIRYFLSSFVMTPINIELFEDLGGVLTTDEDGTYGTDNETIAYHGPFYVDYYEADKILRYEENPNYHNPDEYFYDAYTFMVIEDSAVRFQEFEAGKLEGVSLPTEEYDNYKDNPGLKQVPGSTTFRMMINGLGTVGEQRDQFPGGSWIPEPILANQDFKMAMFFAIDRQKLAEEVLKTSTTQMYLFSDAYLVDAEMGVPYRATDQGVTVGEGLSPTTYGFNQDAAKAYFETAIADLIEEGAYEAGTQAAFTEIELEFYIFSGSIAQSLMGDYIKTVFESTFVSYENYVRIKINVEAKDFPGIYYDYMMTGEFDLAIGGISGSTLDAASFLDVFADDNRGGFTLNWGIDTSVAEIEVIYTDFNDVEHEEMWSFNALVAALNGQVYIVNGEEIDAPAPVITNITPTTYTFEIREFNNPLFSDITYTVQQWDLDNDTYVDVEGMVDVEATTAEITVTGLLPYPYDYQILVNYKIAAEPDQVLSPASTWDYSGDLVKSVDVDGLTATVTLETEDIATRAFETGSVKLFLTADDTEVTTATITIDGATVTISGLDAATEYYITFDTNDGFTDEWVIDYALYADIVTE